MLQHQDSLQGALQPRLGVLEASRVHYLVFTMLDIVCHLASLCRSSSSCKIYRLLIKF